jgi:putative nucleotidyltransferase with HDIG domain
VPSSSILRGLERVNKELLLILSMFVIALLLNHLFDSQRMLLSFYAWPTLGSAYMYGRRHATLTAFASVLIVGFLTLNSGWISVGNENALAATAAWVDLAAWGGTLMITGYLMGTLYEHKNAQLQEMRETYNGVIMLLRHFISKDEYTEHHSYRVSLYATRIAAHMSLPLTQIEDVRAASLLHDIGKLEISRDLLYKAARFTREEYEEIQSHVAKGVAVLETVGGSLRRVIPIVLAHHDKFNGSGYHSTEGEEIPLEARIITVADVYDALTSDRPYRKAMSPFEAKEIVIKGAGTDFDPTVVKAFVDAFRFGEMDVRTEVA